MDRRGFLKTGGAAAVTAGAVASPEPSRAGPARHAEVQIKPGARTLTLTVAPDYDHPGCGADRLARRIEQATDGRYRIVRTQSEAADLGYGSAQRHIALHPAFGFFAGLPLGESLAAEDQHAWLAAGGGHLLWDELAAQHGFKPLVVGHSGAGAGLWSNGRLEEVADFAGLPLSVTGLGAQVVRALGAAPSEIAIADGPTALAAGRVQAAEWLASPLPRTFLSHAPAQRWYGPGLHPAGTVVALSLDRAIWDGLSSADRAIIEACAAEECRLARVERIMRAQMAAHLERPEKWPARAELAPHVMAALRREARRVVAAVAEKDDAARRIAASFFAFRNLLTGPASA